MTIGLFVLAMMPSLALGQFDFGGGGASCSGSGSFEQPIAQGATVLVGKVPSGLVGLEIQLRSPQDVDIVMSSGSTTIIDWQTGLIDSSTAETQVWQSDSITYSGYNGDGSGSGNEFVRFNDETNNPYTISAFGYASGVATVTYSWSGKSNCEGDVPASGEGSFTQAIPEGDTVVVGDLPQGIKDLYIRLDSSSDIDVQLYDGSVAVVDWQSGLIQDSTFSRTPYRGTIIEYSGYNGEQRNDAKGQEYIFIKGALPSTFTLRVLGYFAGTASVNYSWGYYSSAENQSGSSLKSALHNIIDGHTELSYSQCWDALRRTDQNPSDPNKVVAFYSRLSVDKSFQDNGSNGEDAWNREHVWAKSHGNFGTSQGAGTDIHALRAADKSVNSERSAKDFSEGGSALSGAGSREDCPLCLETGVSFEPPDLVKGAVARMIFYMDIRYNGDANSNSLELTVVNGVGTPFGSGTSGNGRLGDLATLKAWNNQYPPSDEEYHRNNIIFDIQGNRNPFIDDHELANSIF